MSLTQPAAAAYVFVDARARVPSMQLGSVLPRRNALKPSRQPPEASIQVLFTLPSSIPGSDFLGPPKADRCQRLCTQKVGPQVIPSAVIAVYMYHDQDVPAGKEQAIKKTETAQELFATTKDNEIFRIHWPIWQCQKSRPTSNRAIRRITFIELSLLMT